MSTTATETDTQQQDRGSRDVLPTTDAIVLNRDRFQDFAYLESRVAENHSKVHVFDDTPAGNMNANGDIAYSVPPGGAVLYHFQTLQQWEGTVIEVLDDDIVSRLRSLGSPMADKRATISREEISDSDQVLVIPGAVFYWTIGYRIELHGQKSLTSVIKFRRLPAWTRREVDRVREIASQLDSFFK